MKLTSKVYSTPEEKKRDFWRGFWLWWGLNILLAILSTGGTIMLSGLAYNSSNASSALISILSTLAGLVPLVINIGLLIYFALTRSQIALGMLVAFGAALALVIVLGIIFTVACFVILGSSSGNL